ncbi:response regulator [bacterium]|nr:response regulator [bacterium]
MIASLKILIVEDSASDYELIRYELSRGGIVYEDVRVETEEQFLTQLSTFDPDIILSDYTLPDFDGMKALRLVQQNNCHKPFIVVTGSINEETAVACMKAGAADYLIKDRLDRLPLSVHNAIERSSIERDKRNTEEQLRQHTEQLRKLHAYLQTAIEKERMAIAREIHDQIGQALTGLKMDISWLERHPSDSSISIKLQSMSELVDETITLTRKISSDLRPAVLDNIGLSAAIEWQTEEFRKRAGIPCDLILPNKSFPIDSNQSTAVFRIYQEILTNIIRHAGATKIKTCLQANQSFLKLTVTDNGRGIARDELHSASALGLAGMRERAVIVGGKLDITGSSAGTIITLTIPMEVSE